MGYTRILAVTVLGLGFAVRPAWCWEPRTPFEPLDAAGSLGFQGGVDRNVDSTAGQLVVPPERLQWHIPDPASDRTTVQQRLERARQENDKPTIAYIERTLQRIDTIRREKQLQLSLKDCLRRTLANNYTIEVQAFNPAVETTRIVEAESAFDAVFFSNLTKNKIDRPTGSTLSSSNIDFLDIQTGVRKALPTGMTVSAGYGFQRTDTALSFQQINPEYFNDLQLEMRQPFLRGFGLDYNLSLIRLAKLDRRISDQAFARQVQDVLRNVEELYWRLVIARRDLAITARQLADFEQIYDYLLARQQFDITPVQLSATKANLEQSRARFIQTQSNVQDAEDRLIAVMNDPEFNLGNDLEIIPTDVPNLQHITVDRLAEAQVALSNRQEIKEQELRVESARILVGRAKNEELPRLDMTFRYTIDGLDSNADAAFDQLTMVRFEEYLVVLNFELPIGNRGPRAASHRARLQHQQAMAQLKSIFEQVLLDVNESARRLETRYDQIGPSFESAEAREREVESIVARAERKDLNTLINELNSRESLAQARRTLLTAMVDYNVALIDLERAKGTLLQYNNVVLPESER